MPLFGTRRHRAPDRAYVTGERPPRSGWARFYPRRDPDRVAGGYRAALANPNTTREGRRHAKWELRRMGRGAHVPFMTKVRRTLGIRSTSTRRRRDRRTRDPAYAERGGCFGPRY